MQPKALILALFLTIVAGGLLVKFSGTAPNPIKVITGEGGPVPPKQGPFAKAIVDGSPVHDFGTMEQGEKGEHVFTIRNTGEAKLEMAMGDHSCQCTLGSLGKQGLAPGEETTVKLGWEIKNPAAVFQHYAKVKTNDPTRPELTFRVRGLVGQRLVVKPTTEIVVGTLSEGKTTERTLTIHSEVLSEFAIAKIESTSPLITVESRPLTAEELKHVTHDHPPGAAEEDAQPKPADESTKAEPNPNADQPPAVDNKDKDADKTAPPEDEDISNRKVEAKCGYELKFIAQPNFPIGKFHEKVTLSTNVEGLAPKIISLQGERIGPVQFLGTPGSYWSPTEGVLRLGRFSAKEGVRARLMLFVNKGTEEFQITEARIEPAVLQYKLVKDPNFKGTGREKYDLFLEFPPGGKVLSHTDPDFGTILFQTNHPEASAIRLRFDFVSY